jgi:excisionase family DNA binding protein
VARNQGLLRDITRVELFTTGEVARVCHVSPRTAQGWIDRGVLQGFRLPGGSKDRRVPRASLAKFLRESGMPAPPWLSAGGLLVTCCPLLASRLPPGADCCRTLMDAGLLWSERRHAAVALDLALGASECAAAARTLAGQGRGSPRLAALLRDDHDAAGVLALGFRAAFAAEDAAALAAFFSEDR